MLVVITGPSGVGKTTIIKSLLKADPCLQYSTSQTSRQPRANELGGVDYRFISAEEFQERVRNDEFVEWSEVYGRYYGRLRSDLEELLGNGDVLVGIDVEGAVKLQNEYPEGIFIFMLPPSEAALEARLRDRKTDDEASIKTRLEAALQEMEQADNFDYKVVNSKIDKTVEEIRAYIRK